MRRLFVFTLLLIFPILNIHAVFGQGNNGSVGGIVQDTTNALIPGVTVTLTNTQTGVVDTRLTNDAGAYNFPSVPPGTYKISGGLSGFSTDNKDGLQVGTQAQLRVDFVLRVGAAAGTQVTVAVDVGNSQLRETSSSVGEVLTSERLRELPVVGGNVLDLLSVLPGFRVSAGGPAFDTVGGLGLDSVNTTINGLSSNSVRQASQFVGYQIFTPTVINPDLVGEIRLILAPVDAELGRGNSQLQIQTRSGTNKYTGSVVWNIQNSAMDANLWSNNHTPTLANGVQVSNRTDPNWQNRNQVTASYGGPIIKNKTFFFFLWDEQHVAGRSLVANTVYTDSAKQGIWKYYPGWNPGNAATPNSACVASGTPSGTYQSVDALGNPLSSVPNALCNQPPVTLRCFSVFGNSKYDWNNNTLIPVNPAVDCSGGTFVPGPNNTLNTWDLRRPGPDPTGYISRIFKLMPEPNNYSVGATVAGGVTTPAVGDGLNTAANRYVRGRKGSANLNAQFGVVNSAADQNNRRSLNAKIDHNINKNHRVNFQWSWEMNDGVGTNIAPWDGGLQGAIHRRPQVMTVNGTSTLSPNLVNEARFGITRNVINNSPAWENLNDAKSTEEARTYLLKGGTNPANGKVYPIIFNPGAIAGGFMNIAGAFDIGNSSPLYDYSDTLRWTHGKHSFSFGGEYRRPITTGFNASAYSTSSVGNPTGAPAQDLADISKFPIDLGTFNQTTRTNSTTLLNLLSGSIATANTLNWVNGYADLKNGTWIDATTQKDIIPTADKVYGHQTRIQISNEWSFFAKDDYKILKGLTLNLGVRYDINLSPYLGNGLTNRFYGDGAGLYGPARPASGNLLSRWMIPGDITTGNGLYLSNYGNLTPIPAGATEAGPQCTLGTVNPGTIPASTCDPNLRSQIEFVGPKTPNPQDTLLPQKGRFSPALGFAWQVPFLGEGKTTIRGGFQRTYGGAGAQFAGGLLSGPGGGDFNTLQINTSDPTISTLLTTGGPAGVGRALTLADLPTLVPGVPTRAPASPLPLISTVTTSALGVTTGTPISYAMYSKDWVVPYTDNFTLSFTHNIARNYTIDIRFVDTIGRKQGGTAGGGGNGSYGSLNLNQVNVYHNKELFDALVRTRAGQNDPLFDRMLIGVNLNPTQSGYGPVGTTTNSVLQRGSAQIRRAFPNAMANGDFATVMQNLYVFAAAGSGLQALPTGVSSMIGRALRNGCDRIANNATLTGGSSTFNLPDGTIIAPRCFAENYLVSNPSVGTAIYGDNFGQSNYQSGQLQFTARPTQGISVQSTYSLSKNLVQPGSGYTDPLNRRLDYGPSVNSIGQEFRTNAIVELPLGPNKLLFGNSNGWFARAIEQWQTSVIAVFPQGTLRSIVGNNMLYANGRPNVVGPWDNPRGHVEWNGDNGNYFGADNPYRLFNDPQCSDPTVLQQATTSTDPGGFSLAASNCTLRGLGKVVSAGTSGAIVDSSGTSLLPLLQNPLPGQQGNLGALTMRTVPRWYLDASVSKRFRMSESKSLALRIDSSNFFNHPIAGDPVGLAPASPGVTSLTAGSNFGQITTKTGSRTFQASLRLTF